MNRITIVKYNVWGVLTLFVSLTIFPMYNLIFLDLVTLSNVEKCPICFGRTMCGCLNKNSFELNMDYIWTNIVSIIREQRSIFGRCKGKSVVVKKRFEDYSLGHLKPETEDLKLIQSKLHKILSLRNTSEHQQVVMCPSIDNLDLLFNHLNDDKLRVRKVVNNTDYLKLFNTIQLSIEPIIQQIARNWSVAEYLGGCGVFTISEYCGYSLSWSAPSLNWKERSSISVQLLQLALNATFDNPDFAFYFTDMSADNFAVSNQNRIKLVDLNNVIIVDKNPKDTRELNSWEVVHENNHDDSVAGFVFSTQEICSHRVSDVNVYSICQGILSESSDQITGGLLHSSPIPQIPKLIKDCVSPPSGKSRFDIARLIIKLLKI